MVILVGRSQKSLSVEAKVNEQKTAEGRERGGKESKKCSLALLIEI
jgi:hypothetical protein